MTAGLRSPAVRSFWEAFCRARGEPGCIIRTAEVAVKPFDQVDARFTWDEGEGDRTLETWREGHRRHFTRQCASWGVAFDERMGVVFERFELVWPDPPSPC